MSGNVVPFPTSTATLPADALQKLSTRFKSKDFTAPLAAAILGAPLDDIEQALESWRLQQLVQITGTNDPGDYLWSVCGTPPTSTTRRPFILVTQDLVDVTDQAERALLADPNLFERGRALAWIVRPSKKRLEALKKMGIEPAQDAPAIELVEKAQLREKLDLFAIFQKEDRKGNVKKAIPPIWAVDTLLSRRSWPYPVLSRLVETPTLRRDGTVIEQPGYDNATGILFEPKLQYPSVPTHPTRKEVDAAIALLLDVIHDFPFVEPCDRGAAIAAMLMMPAREAIPGPTPILAYRAPTPGTGKGRCDEASTIAMTGRLPTLVTPIESDDEWRKRLFAIGLAGFGTIMIDNVKGTFGSPSLSAAATTCEITDRVLGFTKMMTVPFRPVITLTGNNVAFVDDMARRVIPIDLDAKVERPDERTVFKYPDLIEYVKGAHPQLVVAALTILRAYYVAGRPKHGKPKMGSFEAWDDLIRGAVIWLSKLGHSSLGDPCDGRTRLRAEADLDVATIAEVLQAWSARFGETAQSITDAIATAKYSLP